MVCGSPESARAISGKGMGLNPGPESMPSAGANHDGKPRRTVGACSRGGSCERQGQLMCAAGAAQVREWLSVPMRIGGGILCCL